VGELFGRAARVVIDQLEITGLDVQFRVQKTLKPHEPDTMVLSIWNLNEQHRGELQRHVTPTNPAGTKRTAAQKAAATAARLKAPSVQVRLEAGYKLRDPSAMAELDAIGVTGGSLPLIFGGDVREIASSRQGPDWVTVLTGGDGDRSQTLRVNKAFGPGTPLKFAVEQVATELGLGLGQLLPELANAELFDGGQQFASGVVLSGNGFKVLTRLLATAGYTWTVQDGQILVVKKGASFGSAVLLTPDTGLVGSPVPANDGRITARCLLQPDLVPGRQVEFRAQSVQGHYLVETATYVGETAGADWFVEIEVRPL
jgi:hypothetical protein